MMNGKYNGQTKSEYLKNYKRVNDMLSKSNDEDAQVRLAQKQANAITDEKKSLNRAMVAKELGQEHIFEVFFERAYQLGSVKTEDYREYRLKKLGI
jgi:hypothetical protein